MRAGPLCTILAAFDGLRFKVLGQMNTPAMKSDAIDIMTEDRLDGSLWVGTAYGQQHIP